MTTALAVSKQQLTPDIVDMAVRLGPIFKESRLFGVANDSQAVSICLKGFELGLTMTASFEFITVIQDRPALIPRGALALIYNSNELADIKIEDDGNECSVLMKRKNGVEFTASFSMDDAKAAGLVKPGSGWEKYPRQMRQWRAIGFCADFVFPDVLGGLKRADELGADLTVDGEVIEGSWNQTESAQPEVKEGSQPQQAETPRRDPTTWLGELVQEYGAEAVMVANSGRIPGTLEECSAVEETLKNGE